MSIFFWRPRGSLVRVIPLNDLKQQIMSTTLKDLGVGDRGQVSGFEEGGRSYRKKLLSMGLTPGTELEVLRVAPMGDPVEIRVRGTCVSVRKGEAAALQVEKKA